MGNTYFRFKEFTVQQDACAMKVTTDACLFGAIAATNLRSDGKLRVLDIGTGTGLLSLMFAQKNKHCIIDAVELDEGTARQASENFRQSIFRERIKVHHSDIRQYNPEIQYDLVITNPPFYSRELKGPDVKKNMAHHDTGLGLPGLIMEISRLLKPGGKFGILLPTAIAGRFSESSNDCGWYCYKNYQVKQTGEHPVFRNIRFFSREAANCEEEILVIKTENDYTTEFISFLKDYYLHL